MRELDLYGQQTKIRAVDLFRSIQLYVGNVLKRPDLCVCQTLDVSFCTFFFFLKTQTVDLDSLDLVSCQGQTLKTWGWGWQLQK